jgi:hypothetical protein
MKRLIASMMVVGFVASLTAFAEYDKAAAPAGEKDMKAGAPALQDITVITVTGKISKEEPKTPEGKAKFVLTTADGKIDLPETKDEVADLAKMVGKEVKVVGKGKEAGKKVILKSITSVVEAPAAATAAPAAPEVK